LIVPIGKWLIEQACQTLASWSKDPKLASLKLSINCSAVEFMKEDYAAKLIEMIQSYEVDPHLLTIEITESLLIIDSEILMETMKRLNDFHITLATIDDFGTGYSSLAYLKRFPISILKIDRSFVKDLVDDLSDQNLVRAIISVARDFGMSIIAEGVETEAQVAILHQLGGDSMLRQGYLYGKPMRLDLLEEIIRKSKE